MKESIKKRIAEKVRDLLFTMDEEEITMILVGKELNLTAPTLYHYFSGKEEMLLAGNKLISEEISALASIKFPPSIPAQMKIVTSASLVAGYFMKTGLPASYLIEDPKDRPVILKDFRKVMTGLFSEYLKTKKGTIAGGVEKTTYRFLGAMAADIICLRNSKKEMPEDFAEKVFASFGCDK